MATRRLRIKAVANLPARRNRPSASHSSDGAKAGNSSETGIEVTTAGDLTDSTPKDEINSWKKVSAEDLVPSAPEPAAVELPTRKSVIVSAEEAVWNKIDCPSDVTSETDSRTNAGGKIEVETSVKHSDTSKEKQVDKTSVKQSSDESTSSLATLTATNSKSDKADLSDTKESSHSQPTTRGPLRGRRHKPAVNLPAASRKRTTGDTSSAKVQGQESPRSSIDDGKAQELKQEKKLQTVQEKQDQDSRKIQPEHEQLHMPTNELQPQQSLKESTQPKIPALPTSPPLAIPNRSLGNSASDAAKESGPSTTNAASCGSGRRRQTSVSQKAAAARRNFIKHLSKDSPPQRSSLTMFDLIFYNPSSNPMKSDGTSTPKGRRRSRETSVSSLQEDRLREENVDDVGNSSPVEEETAMPVPRVKVGPDGNLVLDEQSLVIETTGTKKCREELERSEVVVDTGGGGHYKRTKRSKDWSDHETKKFYRALHVVGTDFSLMQPLFRSRTRREIKLKFKKEERLNPSLINKALAQPLDFDISELEKEVALEEEEERRLVEESEKNSEASCSINSKDVPRPKQTKKKPSKSSRKSFTSSELCEEEPEPEQPPVVDLESNKEDKNESMKEIRAKTSKPKKNTIYVENEAEADYAMLAMGIDSPAIKVDPSASGTLKRKKVKPKLPAPKRPREDKLHDGDQPCSSQDGGSVTPCNSKSVSSTSRLMVTPGGNVTSLQHIQVLPAVTPTPPTPAFTTFSPVSSTSPRLLPTTPSGSCTSTRSLPTTPTLPRMEPGSIIVLKSPYPQHPDRHILQVYMVTNSSGNNAASPSTRTVPVSTPPPPVPSLVPLPSPLAPVTPKSASLPPADDSESPEKVLTCL